jgi:hypothetical protein
MGAKQEATGLTMQEMAMCDKYLNIEDDACFGNYSACYKAVYDKEDSLTPASLWSIACRKFKESHIKDYIKGKLDGEINEQTITKRIDKIVREKDTQKRDKLKGLELLGKTKAMFTDKHQVEVQIDTLKEEGTL